MLTGSGRSPVSKARGRTSRRNAIAKTRSASAPTSTEHVTWSSGSSTRSSSVGASRTATTSSRPTTPPSSSSLLSGFGYAFMSPRPRCSGGLGAVLTPASRSRFCARARTLWSQPRQAGLSPERSSSKARPPSTLGGYGVVRRRLGATASQRLVGPSGTKADDCGRDVNFLG